MGDEADVGYGVESMSTEARTKQAFYFFSQDGECQIGVSVSKPSKVTIDKGELIIDMSSDSEDECGDRPFPGSVTARHGSERFFGVGSKPQEMERFANSISMAINRG